MNGSSVTLDKVVIEISANANNADENIGKLASTLSELKDAVKGGFNNLSSLAKSLEELQQATKGLKKVSERLANIKEVRQALNSLSNIQNPIGLKNTVKNLERLPDAFSKIDAKSLQNVARVSNELSQALEPLAQKLGEISNGFSTISQMADKYGISITKQRSYVKQNHNDFKLLSKTMNGVSSVYKLVRKANDSFFSNLSKGASKSISKIKQIGLSLLGTRTIFTATRKAVSEYMAMDADLTWKVTNNWRALGAQLSLAIENVTWVFKQFVRVIYSVVLALTGIDLIARANERAMAGWGKAAKDTLGNLQKFDDLNVVEFPKASGDDNQLIDLDPIDLSPIQKVIDWVRKLRDEIKEAWDSGQWEGVGKVFAEGLNDGLAFINFDAIKERFRDIADSFGDFLYGVVTTFDWGLFGEKLTEQLSLIPDLITTFLNNIPWSEIGDGLAKAIEKFKPSDIFDSILGSINSLASGLSTIIEKQDFGQIGEKIGDTIKTILSRFDEFIKIIPWKKLGEALREFILNIDWKGVFTEIFNIIKEIFSGLGDFFSGFTGMNIDGGEVAGTVALILLLVEAFKLIGKYGGKDGKTITKPLENISKGLGDFFKTLGKAATIVAVLGGISAVIHEITDLLRTFSEVGLSLGDTAIILGEVFGAIAIGFTAIALATKLMDPSSFLSLITMFAGLSAVLLTTNEVLKTITQSGMKASDLMSTIGVLTASLLTLVIAFTAAAIILGSDPLALVGILALAGAISLVLLTVAATLPTILDAVGAFIQTIAPPLIKILDTIFNGIDKIINTLNTSLPPVIESIGSLFERIFGGIANIIRTVGGVIISIMTTAKDLIGSVLWYILDFINRLGPAINNFVDNAIIAVTKLINFVISGIEYLINTLIIDAFNGLLGAINNNKIAKALGIEVKLLNHVSISRFTPQLETGTNDVPYEGLYHLHPGEAVVPKKYNPAVGGGSNEETNQRLDMLIDIMQNMNTTTVVNLGNKKLFEEQQKYNRRQSDRYGTDINL